MFARSKKTVALFTLVMFTLITVLPPATFAETLNLQGGSVDVDVQDQVTNWNVSGNPIWNMPEFNVAQNSVYNIAGLSAGASLAVLVNGGKASNIFGTMNLSNLDFILQNIAGINIGASGMINLNQASLIAATLPLNLSATDFLKHDYQFDGKGGFLMNEGTIVGSQADLVALVANAIENRGVIEVPMGTAVLAAGEAVTIGISPDGLVSIGVDVATANELGLRSQIKNTGSITADGGTVSLTAKALDGLFDRAISIERNNKSVEAIRADNGTIVFESLDDIYNNAVVRAMNGQISVHSEKGSVTNAGTLDAEAGKISIEVLDDIVNEAIIKASNGEIFLDSEAGAITNRGILDAPKGTIELRAAGDIETQGILRTGVFREHGYTFRMAGSVEVQQGFMDNRDGAADITEGLILSGTWSDSGTINVLGNFSLSGDTIIWADYDQNGTGAILWGSAYGVTGNNHDLTLRATQASTIGSVSGVKTFTLMESKTDYVPTYTSSPDSTAWTSITGFTTLDDHSFTGRLHAKLKRFTGTGTEADPYVIYDVYGLQAMGGFRTSHFKLNGNIDASSTVQWNWDSGAGIYRGFDPVGQNQGGYEFSGTFDGDSHTISGITIARAYDCAGIFGMTNAATIRNVGLLGGSVSGRAQSGSLVGWLYNASTITNSYATTAVTGSGSSVGGLVGAMDHSTISNSYAMGSVVGTTRIIGGLVGNSYNSSITDSYATGSVTGSQDYIGGLVGYSGLSSIISNSYASGSVTGDSYTGGLVGGNAGSASINNSYASGTVSADRVVGGLVGRNDSASITNSYATGNVSGNSFVGGFIGSYVSGTLTHNYWDTQTTGQATSGGEGAGAVEGKTTAQMKQAATFSGWTFGDGSGDWVSFEGIHYPHLDWEWSSSITTLLQLQNMNLNLAATYTLANDIDASSTAYWNWDGSDYLGFVPVGPFTGTLNGDSHTVSGFTINRPSSGSVGLFTSSSGTISNIGFVDGSVTGADYVGGFAGTLSGSITNSYFEGDVVGANKVGGFAGYHNGASISTSYFAGTVSGGSYVGGLAGSIFVGGITNCYSTSSVLGTGEYIGGLAGHVTQGNISNSYSAGTVRGTGGAQKIGGLVGRLGSGSISNSFNTGVVSGEAPFVWAGAVLGAYQSGTLTNVWYAQHSAALDVGDRKSVSGISMQTGASLDQAKSAFYGSSHAVYTGASPWDFATVPVWDSFASALPLLHAESPTPSTYTIAGLVSGLGAGISMALSLNGAAAVTTTTTDGGAFSFGSVTLNGGEYLLVYANDGSYKANLVGVVQSAGDISGLTMYDGRLAIGDADGVVGTSFTNSTLGSAYYSNSNVYYSVTGGALTVTGIDLWVPSSVTFTPGGSVTVTGAGLNIEGTLNAALNTISAGGSWTNLISGSKVLNVGAVTLTGTGTVTETGSFEDLTITGSYTQSGALTIDGIFHLNGGTFTSDPTVGFSAYDFRLTSGTFSRFTGNGSTETPYTIYDVYGLQAMSGFLSSKFQLNDNINASSTSTWNSGAGFDPVGDGWQFDSPNPFTGTFDGNSKTITGLTIARSSETSVGLFGFTEGAIIRNVGLVGGSVSGNLFVGGLVGNNTNSSSISNSYNTGSVNGNDNYVGGLVGRNLLSSITGSYATGSVSGGNWVGGLVGAHSGSITNSYAKGTVTGIGGTIGGLVGANSTGSITNSYATGNASGVSEVGGLVGNNYYASITNSFSTGVVSGSAPGGLIGIDQSGSLTNNWWYNGTNTVGIGTGSSSGVTKAAALSNFYGTGSGTGGAVYTGASPWDFAATWVSRVGDYPILNGVTPTPTTFTIAGLLSGLGSGIAMALSLDGAAPVTTTTTEGGAFSFGSVTLSGNEYLLIYANDGSYKANLVGRVQSAGNISGLTMYDGRLAIGDAGGVVGTSFTNSSLSSAYYSNANVYYSVTSGALTVSGVDLWIPSAVTYTPGGNLDLSGSLINSGTLNAPANIYVTGNWTNSGTFNAGTGTVTFDGTSSGKQITAGGSPDAFYNVSFTGAAGQWTLQDAMNVSGKFKVTDGSFISGANTVTVEGANATYQNADINAANTTWTGGTLNLQSDTEQTLPDNETYNVLHLGRSAGTGTTVYTRGSNFTFGSLTIDSGDAKVLLTADAAGVNRVYDGSSSATVSFSDDKLSGYENIGYSYSAAFEAGKNVGTGKTVNVSGISLTGSDAIYYSLSSSTDTTTANITPYGLTLTVTAEGRVYDSTRNATSSVASDKFGSDDVTFGSASSLFDTKNVGTAKTVAVSGLSITGGADASNYTLLNTFANTTADITAFALTLNGVTATSKVYDGTTATTVSGAPSIAGVFGGDAVSLVDSGMMSGAFVNKNVGTGKAVIVTGLSLAGADAGNYTVGSLGVTADITAKAVTLSGITALNKVYDGATAATVSTSGAEFDGMIAGDDLTVSSTGVFGDKNVGVGKTVTLTNLLGGADFGNYSITQQGTTTADITAKVLSITGTTNNKIYDGTLASNLNTLNSALSGVVSGDESVVTLNKTGASVAAFASKNVGTYSQAVTGFSIEGAGVGNYSLVQPTLIDATISPKVLTVTGVTAANKAYNGSTAATLDTLLAALVGVLGGEEAVVSLNASSAVGTFANPNVGTWAVAVTGMILTGAGSGNYSLTQPVLSATITSATPPGSGTVDRTINDLDNDPPTGLPPTGSSDPDVEIIDETGDGDLPGGEDLNDGGLGEDPGDPSLPGNDDGQITDGSNGGEVGLSGSGHYDLQDTTRILYALEDYFEAKKARSSQTNVRVLEGVVYVIDGENAMSLLEEGEAIRISYKVPETVGEEGALEFAAQPSSVVQGKVVSPAPVAQGIVPVESPQKTLERDWALAEALKQKESEAEKVSAPKVPFEKIASPIVPLPSKKAQESVKTKPSEKLVRVEPKVVPAPEPSFTKVVSSGTLKDPGKNVFVKGADGQWQPAKDGMVLLPGHEVKTATTSSVNVVLDEGKVGYVELKGGSLFRINKVETDSVSGDKTTLLDLAVGRALVHAAKLQGKSRFEVRTPTAISGVRGTVFEIVVNEKPLSGAI